MQQERIQKLLPVHKPRSLVIRLLCCSIFVSVFLRSIQTLLDDPLFLNESRHSQSQLQKSSQGLLDHHLKSTTPSPFQPNELCALFPSQPFTASHVWQTNLPKIIEASKNPLVSEFLNTPEEDAKLHTLLTETLTASRFRRAVQNIPSSPTSSSSPSSTFSSQSAALQKVIQVLEKRIQDPQNNPPLRIAVFGGSVTIGRSCDGQGRRMQYYDCAWPMRLQLLINQFADMELVKVYNLGIGGTSSAVGTNMVKYWMYPDDTTTTTANHGNGGASLKKVGPDVIINSYSTNDSLPPWELRDDPTADMVTAVLDGARNSLQTFMRAALLSKRCDIPPLVVHVDDYLGPQQTKGVVLGEISYNVAMNQLAKWYNTFAVSYGDLVRDLAWLEEDSTFYNKKDVHYGHWAHQTIAWAVGFASLELVSGYCDDEYARRMNNNKNQNDYNDVSGENNIEEIAKNFHYLPPPLTRELLQRNAKQEHLEAIQTAEKSYQDLNCASKLSLSSSSSSANNNTTTTNVDNNEDKNPCIVSWIASPGGYNVPQINSFMKTYSSHSNTPIHGWQTENQNAEGWGNKIGWIATQLDATFTLQFNEVEKDVTTITVFYLRSYGEKWKDSLAKFTVTRLEDGGDGKVVAEDTIAGVSADEHSLTLSQELNLSETIRRGESIRMKVDLVGGTTFKIMGLMVCS